MASGMTAIKMADNPASTFTCPQLTSANGNALPNRPERKIKIQMRPAGGSFCPAKDMIGYIINRAMNNLDAATVSGGISRTLIFVKIKLRPKIAASDVSRR